MDGTDDEIERRRVAIKAGYTTGALKGFFRGCQGSPSTPSARLPTLPPSSGGDGYEVTARRGDRPGLRLDWRGLFVPRALDLQSTKQGMPVKGWEYTRHGGTRHVMAHVCKELSSTIPPFFGTSLNSRHR